MFDCQALSRLATLRWLYERSGASRTIAAKLYRSSEAAAALLRVSKPDRDQRVQASQRLNQYFMKGVKRVRLYWSPSLRIASA